MYWPWDLIGENMQLCLAGLRDVDRLVEIYTYNAFAQHLMKHQNGIRARQVLFIRSQCFYENINALKLPIFSSSPLPQAPPLIRLNA